MSVGHRASRSALSPELPTVAELGVPGFEAVLHYGIVAPAGTPRPVVERLTRELVVALGSDEVRARLVAEALPGSPEDYAADIDREERKWSRIVRASAAKVE